MSALRFAAGLAVGIALAALVAGAAGHGAPVATDPDRRAPTEEAAAPVAPPAKLAPEAPRESVARGVLARAAASRRTKTPETAPAAASTGGGSGTRDVVIESVEVDWGAAPARP
jgi:hypothetical protein